MSPEARAEADAHLSAARSWSVDRQDSLAKSRRIAWIVALIAAAIALVQAIALFTLLPLKTVVPYTLLVDRQTGYVQALDPIEARRIAPDAALTQSFLVQYVLGREGFDFATVERDYRKVSLWSADSARSDYVNQMQVANPDSPLIRYPRSTAIEARVRSVSSLGPNTALVRFETARRDRSATPQPVQGWVALVTYRYSNASMSVEDRYLNPLGFQVVRYRRNAETPPAPAIPELATGGAAAAQLPSAPSRPTP